MQKSVKGTLEKVLLLLIIILGAFPTSFNGLFYPKLSQIPRSFLCILSVFNSDDLNYG